MPVPLIAAACLALPEAQDRPEDEGQKNLAAIREVLSQYPFNSRSSVQRSAGSSAAPSQEVPRPPAVSLPGDHPLLEPSPYPYSHGVPITPNRSSAQDLKVTIPWKPPKPQALVPEEPCPISTVANVVDERGWRAGGSPNRLAFSFALVCSSATVASRTRARASNSNLSGPFSACPLVPLKGLTTPPASSPRSF
jgi:hypothetical protein